MPTFGKSGIKRIRDLSVSISKCPGQWRAVNETNRPVGAMSSVMTSSTRARLGPRRTARSKRSTASASPSARISTEPSGRFPTQPVTFSSEAISMANHRNPTPCTRPDTSSLRAMIMIRLISAVHPRTADYTQGAEALSARTRCAPLLDGLDLRRRGQPVERGQVGQLDSLELLEFRVQPCRQVLEGRDALLSGLSVSTLDDAKQRRELVVPLDWLVARVLAAHVPILVDLAFDGRQLRRQRVSRGTQLARFRARHPIFQLVLPVRECGSRLRLPRSLDRGPAWPARTAPGYRRRAPTSATGACESRTVRSRRSARPPMRRPG